MTFGDNNGFLKRIQFLVYNTSSTWDTGSWDITIQTRVETFNSGIVPQSQLNNYIYGFYANNRASSSGAQSGMNNDYISSYICQQWSEGNDWFIRCKFYTKQPIKFFMIELNYDESALYNYGMYNTKVLRWWGITNFTGSTDSTSAINNQTQVIQNEFENLDNTLTDDSVDNPSSMISDFEDLLPSNGVITQLIALPITLYQKVLNSINGTCSSFNLGSLYGTNLVLPCIELSNILGSSLVNIIDLMISGFFILHISKKMVKAFESFTSMKEGDVIDD